METVLKRRVNSVSDKKKLEKRYQDLREKLEKIHGSETLAKYRILSEAYRIGKQVHGKVFTVIRLAKDFDIPYTTVKRVLSLDRASKYTWKMIDDEKISAHKAAQICMAVHQDKQNEVIKMAIDQGLSTYQIKRIRVYDGDFRKLKLSQAISKGFAGRWNAMYSFTRSIHRLEELLKLDISTYPAEKKAEIQVGLERLRNKIDTYLTKFGGKK